MTEQTTLPMTDGEICEMYRSAAKRSKQIGILAQLNLTTPERIAEILRAGGYTIGGRQMRYAQAGEPQREMPSSGPAGHLPPEGEGFGGEAADTHTHTHTHTHSRPGRRRSRYGGCGRSWRSCRRIARSAWGRRLSWDIRMRRPQTCSRERSGRWCS